jgi:tetratricopeptide (TPR) repeat protein
MYKKLSRVLAVILIMSLLTLSVGCSKNDSQPAGNPSADSNGENNTGNPSGKDQNGTENSITGQDSSNTGSNSQDSNSSDISEVQPDIIRSFEIPLSTSLEEYSKAYEQLKNYHVSVPTEYKAFFDYAEKLRDIGVEYKSVGANIAGEYCIHFAGSCVTSVRNCIDEILKKRGISVEDGIYTDWKDIVSINYTCPVPYYMQSVYNVYAGNMDDGKKFYELAKLNEESFPDGIQKLEGIVNLSDDELKSLREELVNFENYLYDIYPAIPSGWETTGYEFQPEFFVMAYYYCLEMEDYENALVYADAAVRNNPLDTQLYKVAAVTATMLNDDESMWYYISNGIMLDNAEGDIVTLAVTFWVSVQDYDMAKNYIEMAHMGNLSAENEQAIKNAETLIKEAGK